MVISTSVTPVQSDANAANNSAQSTLNVSAVTLTESSGGGSLSIWFLLSMLLLAAAPAAVRYKAVAQRIAPAGQQ